MSSRPADFKSQRCRLERAHHHRPPEEAQNTQLSLTDGCGSLARVYNECGGRQSRGWTRVAVAPHKTSNTSWRNDFSIATLPRALIPATMSTLLPDTTLPAIWLARGLRVVWVNCISAAETVFCFKSCTSDEQTPRLPSPAHHKTFRPAHQCNSFAIPLTLRCRRVWSSNLNTQLRRTQGVNTESLTMPAAVADPKQSLDSEQISPATIAHTTQCTKIHQTFTKAICVNGEHSHTWWVHYLGSWANLLFRHGCQGIFCLWKWVQMAQIAPFHWRRHSTAFHFMFITVCILGYKKQKTGIREQSRLFFWTINMESPRLHRHQVHSHLPVQNKIRTIVPGIT